MTVTHVKRNSNTVSQTVTHQWTFMMENSHTRPGSVKLVNEDINGMMFKGIVFLEECLKKRTVQKLTQQDAFNVKKDTSLTGTSV